MSEALILVGGMAWVFVVITLAGYSSVLLAARKGQTAVVGYVCTVFLVVLGLLCIKYAPYIAQTWVWD